MIIDSKIFNPMPRRAQRDANYDFAELLARAKASS